MSGLADSQDLEIDASRLGDRALVFARVRLDLPAREVPPGNVHVAGLDVDVLEEILPHEAVVAVEALGGHRVVLVEVEGHDLGEVESFLAMEPDQLPVDSDGGGTGREPQDGSPDGGAPLADETGDAPGDEPGNAVVGFLDDDRDPFRTFAHGVPIGRGSGFCTCVERRSRHAPVG